MSKTKFLSFHKIVRRWATTMAIAGILIFLVWFVGRNYFAVEMVSMEVTGMILIMVGINVGLFCTILWLIYFWANQFQAKFFHIYPILFLFFNIPLLFILLKFHRDADRFTYVRITNQYGVTLKDIRLHSTFFEKDIGNLDSNDSRVFIYKPELIILDARPYSARDTMFVLFKSNGRVISTFYPVLGRGCEHFIIDTAGMIRYESDLSIPVSVRFMD